MSWCGGGEDQRNARYRVAQPRDQRRDLVGGQLAAFAGLRALRDLDLELVRAHEVLGRDPEPARRDLF